MSSLSVRPLLLYYGVLALTRATIIFISRNRGASSLCPAHGLETGDWRGTLATGNSRMGELTATIRRGTFSDLIEATENATYFRHGSSGVSWKFPYTPPENGVTLTFVDLIRAIPDTQIEYESWTDETFSFGIIKSFKLRDTPATWKTEFTKLVNREQLFPESIYGDVTFNENGGSPILASSNDHVPYFSQFFGRHGLMAVSGIGDIWVVPPLRDGSGLNVISMYFAVAYYLGMLVRYYPVVWDTLSRGESDDAIFPLLIRLNDLVAQRYPLLASDLLRAPYEFERVDAT